MIYSLPTGQSVSPTAETSQPVAASGATLWGYADTTITVEPGVWAVSSIGGRTLLGWATTATAANIVFVCEADKTVLIYVPIGTTHLHYRCEDGRVTAFIRKVKETERTAIATTLVSPAAPASNSIYDLYDLYKVWDDLTASYTQRADIDMARTNPATHPDEWSSTLNYSEGDMCVCTVGGTERTYFALLDHAGFTPEAATNTYWRMAWTTAEGWNPIGTVAAPFTGTFIGTGYTISNIFILRATTNLQGLFGYVASATFVGVGIVGGSVTGQIYVGGLVGFSQGDGLSTSCYSTCAVTGTQYTGGLVGYSVGAITSCYATGAVTGTQYTGGLVGYSTGAITSCYATGAVSGTSSVGGLVGLSTAAITGSYAQGAVTGTGHYVGGLVGVSSGAISLSYATGSVTQTGAALWHCGGLVGNNINTITNCYAKGSVTGSGVGSGSGGGIVGYNNATITNCYSIGLVSGFDPTTGGLVGQNDGGTYILCYWDLTTSGQATSSGGTGFVTADMVYDYGANPSQPPDNAALPYNTWNFTTIWNHGAVGNYPILR